MKKLCMIILLLAQSACQTGIFPISNRESLYEKEGKSPHMGHRRPVEEKPDTSPQIYVKRESLSIRPKETENYSGSLLALDRAENLYYMDPARGRVGEVLDIEVKVSRSESTATTPATSPDANQQGNSPKKDSKALQDELIAALPKLEPGDGKAKIPQSIKMRVVDTLENGDVLVEAQRSSKNDWDANTIRVISRIQRSKLASSQALNTGDLVDVNWYEIQGANTIERESSGWEDEYTVRWAGFEEARSKSALELENKRLDLQKVKERLQERIANLGKERGQISLEREKTRKLREEAEQKLQDMNKKIEEQTAVIEQQKEALLKQEALLSAQSNPEEASKKEEPKK